MGYKVREEIKSLNMYKAGKPISEVKRELGLDEVIKLASNENPLGCSEKAKEAINNLINETQLYPDASNYELKEEIAKHLNVKPTQIFTSTGSDALLKVVCNTLLNPEDECIMAEVTFPRYEASVKLMGSKVVKVPMKDNGLDIEKMVDSITDKTKIIWFCNPNNPTGTIFKRDDFSKVLKRIPEDVIIVMDEAYIEYVTDEEFPDSLEFFNDYPNMIILRTFSKAYGLAALRCGYGIAHEELVGYFNRVIGPFDVNLFAQKAAVAAIKDQKFIEKVCNENIKSREYLYKEFDKLELPYIKTNTNFIMVNAKTDDMKVFNNLLKRGIIIRPGTLLGMPGWMRVTIGTLKQNEKFIEALKQSL